MAATSAISDLFHIYDVHQNGSLTMDQLHEMYSQIRIGGISLSQVVDKYVCL